MAINIESEASCRKAYLNYHCYGNSMNISASEMGEITSRWSGKLSSWQATVAQDENQYEFDDSDYANYKNNGQEQAKENTGYGGGKGDIIVRGSVDGAAGVAGACSTTIGKKVAGEIGKKLGGQLVAKAAAKAGAKAAQKAAEEAAKKASEEVLKKAGEKAAEEATKKAAEEAAKKAADEAYKKSIEETTKKVGAWSVTAPLALAVATAYTIKKPNKDQKEACDQLLATEMPNSQVALSDTQADMESMADELIDLSDEANEANEDANDEMKDKKAEYDTYKTAFENLKAKVESGESLTDDEKALWQELVKYMTEAGEDITTTQEDTTDLVGEIYDDMNTYQEGYDYAAETMGEVEGITDFAEGFDSATRTMCYVEMAAQGLNAASGGTAGIQAGIAAAASLGFNPWAWACAAMGGTAAYMSGQGMLEQMQWASEIGNEIDVRGDTQDFHAETMDVYDEEVDGYDGLMQGIEDLEIEVPEDVAPPEDAALPPSTGDGFPTGTPDPLKPEGQGTNPGTTGQPSQTGTSSPAPAANAPAQQPPANNAPAGTQQPINPQVATTSAPSTAGGEIKAPQTVIPAQCAAAITTTLGLPPATSGDAFDPAQIPSIIANLAPGYDEETIRNVMNGIQTDNTPAQPAAGPANKDEDASNTPVQTPVANQPNTQALKAKIAFYKPMLDQAAINGWKM